MNYLYYGQIAKDNQNFLLFCVLSTSYLMRSVRVFQKSNVTKLWSVHYGGDTPQVNVCRCQIMTSPIWNRVRVWIRFSRGVVEKLSRTWLLPQKSHQNPMQDHERWTLLYLSADSGHVRAFRRWKQHQLFERQWKWTQPFHAILKIIMSPLDDLVLRKSTQGCCFLFLKPRNATGRVQFTRNQAGCSLQSINQMYYIILFDKLLMLQVASA